MRFMRECCVCWASGFDGPEIEFSRARVVEVGFVGAGRDLEGRRESSGDLSGEEDSKFEDGFGTPGSSKVVLFRGEDGKHGLRVLKKLTAKAGFSNMMSRKRRSSFRFKGRPGLLRRTSLVLINARNNL